MKTIYVVTEGQYSDYHICGVFDDRGLAEKFCATFTGGYDTPEIEEWPINPLKKELKAGYIPYFLRMDKEGNTTEIRASESSHGFGGDEAPGFDIGKNMYTYCLAKDSAHAMKIANEQRLQILAENRWPA